MQINGDDRVFKMMKPRERQVARLLITKTPTDREMAEELGISLDTVRSYMQGLLTVTGMGNRTELALFIVRRPTLEKLILGECDDSRI